MYGDKWWGYLHSNHVVTISQQEPKYWHSNILTDYIKAVGPFTEDLADEFEGDIKMVRRRIMAALEEKPLEELLRSADGPHALTRTEEGG